MEDIIIDDIEIMDDSDKKKEPIEVLFNDDIVDVSEPKIDEINIIDEPIQEDNPTKTVVNGQTEEPSFMPMMQEVETQDELIVEEPSFVSMTEEIKPIEEVMSAPSMEEVEMHGEPFGVVLEDESSNNEFDNLTYDKDNSLSNNDQIVMGLADETNGPNVQDTISIFDVDDSNSNKEVMSVNIPKVEIPATPLYDEPISNVETPDLSDDLDNTLMIAKKAINPDAFKEKEEVSYEPKKNKIGIFLIVMLFIILALFIFSLPYLNEFFGR